MPLALAAPPTPGDWPMWTAMLTDRSVWRWTLADMAVLAILPFLAVTVGATVAIRRARI